MIAIDELASLADVWRNDWKEYARGVFKGNDVVSDITFEDRGRDHDTLRWRIYLSVFSLAVDQFQLTCFWRLRTIPYV